MTRAIYIAFALTFITATASRAEVPPELYREWDKLNGHMPVCRQNISDIWFGDKRVCGSSGLEVQAAIAC